MFLLDSNSSDTSLTPGDLPSSHAFGFCTDASDTSSVSAGFLSSHPSSSKLPLPVSPAPSLDASDFDFSYLEPWEGPAILLVDLDAFFASVEQRDNPGWRGKPVIVGGDPDKRGVVATASYEARAFGVASAMPSSQARRLCPQAIWTRGHFDKYRATSNQIMEILREETPFVQQVSIDEAFMDVSPTRLNHEHPVCIAQRIQKRIEDLGVTCSVGVGSSKTVAKIASDMDKPRGLTVVYPGREQEFLRPLPVRTLSGIGSVAERKLKSRGINTLGELASLGEERLVRWFGKNGSTMYLRACGKDDSSIEVEEETKSVSNETSFAKDLHSREEIEAAVSMMAAKLGRRLRRKGLAGKTLALRLRFDDRSVHSVQCQLPAPTNDDLFFTSQLLGMIDQIWRPGIPVRLVGVAMSNFAKESFVQEELDLFEEEEADKLSSSSRLKEEQRRSLLEATDKLKDRFGEEAVRFGHELRFQDASTGSAAKNPADYK